MKHHFTYYFIIVFLIVGISLITFRHCNVHLNDTPKVEMQVLIRPSCVSEALYNIIIDHIDYEKNNQYYQYPDTIICAGVWFDVRGAVDSILVLGGPMAPINDNNSISDVTFIGYYKDTHTFISFASLGRLHPKLLNENLIRDALNNSIYDYQRDVDSLVSCYINKDVCKWLVSSYCIEKDSVFVLSSRTFRQ